MILTRTGTRVQLRYRALAMSSNKLSKTLPHSAIASVTVDLAHNTIKPQEFAARLRDHAVPVIGYVARGSLKLDLRTIFPRQDAELIAALRAVCR